MMKKVLRAMARAAGFLMICSPWFAAGQGLPQAQDDGVSTSDAQTLPKIRVESGPDAPAYAATRSAAGAKIDTPLIETPVSVSVVTSAQIKAQGADSLSQAFDYTAGIFALGGGANRRSSTGFTVRGFNVTGSAPLYVNGSKFPINSLSGAVEPFGAERVELIKGPASIPYGQAPPGGLINVVTKRPPSEPFRDVEVELGSFDRRQFTADVGGTLRSGAWGYRVTALVRDSDSMVDYINDDRVYVSPVVDWRPSERTSLTVLASYYDNQTAYDYGKPFEGSVAPNPNGTLSRRVFVGEPGFNHFDTKGRTAGYLFEHRSSGTWQFRQNALFFDYESDYADIAVGAWSTPALDRVNRSPYTRLDGDDGFSIDNQVQAAIGTGRLKQTVLLGIDYSSRDFTRLQRSGTVAPLNLFDPVYGSPVTLNANPVANTLIDSTQLGLYAQDHLKLDEHWVLLLGGRWDEARNDQTNRLTAARSETDDNAFTARAGLLYLFDGGVAPYVSYSESFQLTSGADFFGNAFEPTTGRQYEAGVKYQPLPHAASVTLSVYEITQQNVLTSDPAHPAFSVQTGEVRSRGVELEGSANLGGLDLIAAFARTDAEVTRSNGSDLGRTPMGVPERTASLWVDYTLRGGFGRGLGLAAGVRYVGDSLNDDNSIEVPSYTIMDAAVRYQRNGWRAAVNVKNVFDKEYLAQCTFACFYGDERTINVSAGYRW